MKLPGVAIFPFSHHPEEPPGHGNSVGTGTDELGQGTELRRCHGGDKGQGLECATTAPEERVSPGHVRGATARSDTGIREPFFNSERLRARVHFDFSSPNLPPCPQARSGHC